MLKITFGMIVFESDFVLKQCLEQVYPYAYQIVIAEGPVKYWQDQGRLTSTDNTNYILNNFPDPENKITTIHSQYLEKDDQCRTYIDLIKKDTDYLWNLDADEVYKDRDLLNIIDLLKQEKPSSVGMRSNSFYGGFDNYLTGFELKIDNFLRIFKYEPGCTWLTHRPPTIKYPNTIAKKHINSDELFNMIKAQMYHYSYVFPDQVFRKINYYKTSVSKQNCINDYFQQIYLPWVTGSDFEKKSIENKYYGVHEFLPHIRGECYTSKFIDSHPESITKDLSNLKKVFNEQLQKYI